MYCKYCGCEIPAGSAFCNYCGKNLGKSKNEKETPRKEKSTLGSYEGAYSEQKTFEKPPFKRDTYDAARQANNTGDLNSLLSNVKKVLGVLWRGAKIILVIVVILYSLDPYRNIINIKDMRKAYHYSKEVISEEILAKEYEFPKFEPDFATQRTKTIEHEGVEFDVHTVTAYVYIENAFGTMVRNDYEVEIGFPKDKDVDGYYYRIIYF